MLEATNSSMKTLEAQKRKEEKMQRELENAKELKETLEKLTVELKAKSEKVAVYLVLSQANKS